MWLSSPCPGPVRPLHPRDEDAALCEPFGGGQVAKGVVGPELATPGWQDEDGDGPIETGLLELGHRLEATVDLHRPRLSHV